MRLIAPRRVLTRRGRQEGRHAHTGSSGARRRRPGVSGALLQGDSTAARDGIAALDAGSDAIEASAPPALAEDVALMAGISDVLAGVDPGDIPAVSSAFTEATTSQDVIAAQNDLHNHALHECDLDPGALIGSELTG